MQNSQVSLVDVYSSGYQKIHTAHFKSVYRNGAQESPATGFIVNCPLEVRVNLMTKNTGLPWWRSG